MSRSNGAERAERLNAAFDLLAQGRAAAQAAAMLTEEFGLSQRQAYRYVQEAQAIKRPVPVSAPSVAITVKVPEDVAAQLREHAQATGSTIGDVVARAVSGFSRGSAGVAERHQRRQVRFEYCFDRLFGAKLEQVYDILVPDRTRRTGAPARVGGHGHEDSSDLCPGVLGPAEGGQDDRQPDGGAGGVRLQPRLQRTG